MPRPTRPSHSGPPPAEQTSLFDDLPPQAPPSGPALVAIPLPAAEQTKAQRQFNKLIQQIRQQRSLLAQWQQFEVHFNQRLSAELHPAQARLSATRLDLLRLLDHLHSDQAAVPRLSKPQRSKLRAWIPQLAQTLLEDGPNAEAEAIFDRYSDTSHAEQRQIELAAAEALMGHFLGEDILQGHQAESMDELMRHAAEGLARADAERAERATSRQQAQAAKAAQAKPGKAQTARQRKAEAAGQAAELAAKQAGQSVREAFRKLASALHPDRETDPAARAHKTQLMQQANQAYERNDLLTLLSMQLDLEQIDGEHLAGLPEARLAHYNQVLREQLQALQHELGSCTAHFRQASGSHQRELTPEAVDAALGRDIRGLRQWARQLEADIALLRDPATRRQTITEIELPELDDDGPDEFEAMLMMEALAGGPASRPSRKKGRPR